MPQYRFRIITPAGTDAAWKIVGDLGGLDHWVPGVTECKLEGDIRTCTFADGRVQAERVVAVNRRARSYGYEIDGAAMGMTNSGSFRVKKAPGGSLIEWDADVEFSDAKVAAQMVPMLDEGYAQAALALAKAVTAI